MTSSEQSVGSLWCDWAPLRDAEWKETSLRYADEGAAQLQAILAVMSSRGFSRTDLFAVHLALEEALVNAMEHGNHRHPNKRVFLRYCVDGEKFMAEIEDEGSGFAPASVPDPALPENLCNPRGRGLKLIRRYMDCVLFNDRGNCIRMGRRRSTR